MSKVIDHSEEPRATITTDCDPKYQSARLNEIKREVEGLLNAKTRLEKVTRQRDELLATLKMALVCLVLSGPRSNADGEENQARLDGLESMAAYIRRVEANL
jgi:hypothetical protein